MKLYKYLFYRLYIWNLKKWGEEDVPQWNALLGVTFMMYANILTMLHVFLQFFDINIFMLEQTPKKEIVILFVSLIVINFFIFIFRNKYLSIVSELKAESKKKKQINLIFLWLYVILSFTLPIVIP